MRVKQRRQACMWFLRANFPRELTFLSICFRKWITRRRCWDVILYHICLCNMCELTFTLKFNYRREYFTLWHHVHYSKVPQITFMKWNFINSNSNILLKERIYYYAISYLYSLSYQRLLAITIYTSIIIVWRSYQ